MLTQRLEKITSWRAMNVGTGSGIFVLASGHLLVRVHHREVRHKVQDPVFLKLLNQNVDMCIFELEEISDAPAWVLLKEVMTTRVVFRYDVIIVDTTQPRFYQIATTCRASYD